MHCIVEAPDQSQNDLRKALNYAKKTALWIVHGSDDRTVHPYYSIRMANAVIQAGGSPKLTLYNNVKHNSWLNIFRDPRFLPWIYRHKKK